MGRSRYAIREQQAPHFLTCTVLNWMPLFTRPQTVNIVIDALKYRQENHGWKIYGYVILENHLHLIVQAENLISELPRFKSALCSTAINRLFKRVPGGTPVKTNGVFS
jgi:REP element-mobilizing transposase RayT